MVGHKCCNLENAMAPFGELCSLLWAQGWYVIDAWFGAIWFMRNCHLTCAFVDCRSASLEPNQASMDWK